MGSRVLVRVPIRGLRTTRFRVVSLPQPSAATGHRKEYNEISHTILYYINIISSNNNTNNTRRQRNKRATSDPGLEPVGPESESYLCILRAAWNPTPGPQMGFERRGGRQSAAAWRTQGLRFSAELGGTAPLSQTTSLEIT